MTDFLQEITASQGGSVGQVKQEVNVSLHKPHIQFYMDIQDEEEVAENLYLLEPSRQYVLRVWAMEGGDGIVINEKVDF